jgi:hypothetical protein
LGIWTLVSADPIEVSRNKESIPFFKESLRPFSTKDGTASQQSCVNCGRYAFLDFPEGGDPER